MTAIKRTHLYLLVIVLSCTACVVGIDDGRKQDAQQETGESEFIYNPARLWGDNITGATIPVCFSPSYPGTPTLRNLFKKYANTSWSRAANISFTGWGLCASDAANGTDLLIRINSPADTGSSFVGKAPIGYGNWIEWHSATPQARGDAVHELGHILGLYHEHERRDAHTDCGGPADPDGYDTGYWRNPHDGAIPIGLIFERNSIMSYCCDPTAYDAGKLSNGDIAGIQQIYGPRKAGIALYTPSLGIFSFDKDKSLSFTTADYGVTYHSNTGRMGAFLGQGRTLTTFAGGTWWVDSSNNQVWNPASDTTYYFGSAADKPVTGYWNGRQDDMAVGIVYNSTTWVLDMNADGSYQASADKVCTFGFAGGKPVVGNWVGSPTNADKVGSFHNGSWIVDTNENCVYDAGDQAYSFGSAADQPVVGDFDGDGKDNIAIFYPGTGTWAIDWNGNGTWDGTPTDKATNFGSSVDTAIVYDR